MKVATAFVELRADRSKMGKDLDAVEADVKSKANSTAKTFGQIFGAVAFGAVVKGSIDAASNLNETVSKTKVLFGENSDAVIAFSKTTAQSMGLSQQAYLDAAAGLKGLLDNLGLAPAQATEWSQTLTQLGSDLGSFFNKDPAEAVEAIGSAMRGESEPIRAFNVQINEAAIKQQAMTSGLWDGVGAIDSNAKAQATLALIMAQTTAAQGDFVKTADGAANSQRIAKAEMQDSAASIGQSFLPVYTKVVQLVGQVAKGFAALPGPIQEGVLALVALIALAGPLGNVKELFSGLTDKIKLMSTNTKSAATGLGVLAGVTLVAFSLRAQHAADQAERIATNIDKMSGAATNAEAVHAYGEALATMVVSGQHADDAMAHLAQTNLEGAKRVLAVGEANGFTREQLDGLRAAVEAEEAARAKSTAELVRYEGALEGERHGLDQAKSSSVNYKEAQEELAAATEEAKRKSDAFADALQRQLDKLDELYPKAYDAVQAKYDYADSQAAAMVAVDNLNTTLDDNKSKQEDVDAATRSARDAILDQSEKYATLDGAALGSQGAIARQIASLEAQRDTLAPGSPLRTFLDQYIADLKEIPGNIDTFMNLHISSSAVNPGAPGYLPPGGRGATGQPTRRGALMEYGEMNRPEVYEQDGKMYLLPTAGGQVMPWGEGGGRGGGSQSIVINNNGRDFGVGDMHHVLAMARLM